MSKLITLKAQVESVATRKDRTIKIAFSTQELKGTDAAQLLDLQNELVTLGINPKGLDDDEINLLLESKFGIEDIPNQKSKSQTLRSVLFLNWKQEPKGFSTFQNYYDNKMDAFIEHCKKPLN